MSPYKNPEDAKARGKRYYQQHKAELQDHYRKRYHENKEKFLPYRREYHLKNQEKEREYQRIYYRAHRTEILQLAKVNRIKNKEKFFAQGMARSKVPLASGCQMCGATERLERHHSDYDKPLEIMTLCHRCHTILHHKSKATS
jgi:hypothetical protein